MMIDVLASLLLLLIVVSRRAQLTSVRTPNTTTQARPAPPSPTRAASCPAGPPMSTRPCTYINQHVSVFSLSMQNALTPADPHPDSLTDRRCVRRLEEEERYLKLTAREIRRLCMLTLAFIRQASHAIYTHTHDKTNAPSFVPWGGGRSPMIRNPIIESQKPTEVLPTVPCRPT